MSRSGSIGSVKKVGTDSAGKEVWSIEVQVGSNGVRDRAFATHHGTEREAQLLAAQLRSDLCNKPVLIANVTLDELFYSIIIPEKARAGKTKETISGYMKNYTKWISPRIGTMMVNEITRADAQRLILESNAKENTRKTLSMVLNYAFLNGYMGHQVSLKGIEFVRKRKQKPKPWSGQEILDAIEKLKGCEPVELAFYIGICGYRKEEILGAFPADFSIYDRVDAAGNPETEAYIISHISRAYTDKDGLKVTKTPDSVRHTPMLKRTSGRFIELLNEMRPSIECVGDDLYIIKYISGWKRSQKAEYKDHLIEGPRREAEALAKELGSASNPFGYKPKIERFGETYWIVREFIRFTSIPEREYRSEPFRGTYQEAVEHATEKWMNTRLIPCTADYLGSRWKTALQEKGLRYIPLQNLRHSSETLMALSGVPEWAISKLHGHTGFDMDYAHYIDPGIYAAMDSADKTDAYLESPDAKTKIRQRRLL